MQTSKLEPHSDETCIHTQRWPTPRAGVERAAVWLCLLGAVWCWSGAGLVLLCSSRMAAATSCRLWRICTRSGNGRQNYGLMQSKQRVNISLYILLCVFVESSFLPISFPIIAVRSQSYCSFNITYSTLVPVHSASAPSAPKLHDSTPESRSTLHLSTITHRRAAIAVYATAVISRAVTPTLQHHTYAS